MPAADVAEAADSDEDDDGGTPMASSSSEGADEGVDADEDDNDVAEARLASGAAGAAAAPSGNKSGFEEVCSILYVARHACSFVNSNCFTHFWRCCFTAAFLSSLSRGNACSLAHEAGAAVFFRQSLLLLELHCTSCLIVDR